MATCVQLAKGKGPRHQHTHCISLPDNNSYLYFFTIVIIMLLLLTPTPTQTLTLWRQQRRLLLLLWRRQQQQQQQLQLERIPATTAATTTKQPAANGKQQVASCLQDRHARKVAIDDGFAMEDPVPKEIKALCGEWDVWQFNSWSWISWTSNAAGCILYLFGVTSVWQKLIGSGWLV